MLSQKIVLELTFYKNLKSEEEKDLQLKEVNRLINIFKTSHEKILAGKWIEGEVHTHSPFILDHYENSGLNRDMAYYLFLAEKNIAGEGDRYKFENSFLDDLLEKLNTAVFLFEKESYLAIQRFIRIELGLMLFTLFTLLLEALFIFRPVSRILDRALNELSEAKGRAEKALSIKSEFLAVISHEIRTPLNAIIGMTTLLKDEKLSEEGSGHLKVIRRSGKNLNNLINDVLDFSKIEANKMSLDSHEFNIEDIVRQTTSLFYANAKERNLDFDIFINNSHHHWIRSDSARIQQVISNLLSNAIKFSSDDKIIINLESQVINDHQVEYTFSIKDYGIGMSVEQQENLFELFQQGDSSTTRKFGGSGLGLAISKNLAELLEGDISLESEEGKGSTFYFKFRASIIDKPIDIFKDEEIEIEGLQFDYSMMVVDDNSVNLTLLIKYLEKLGVDAVKATNGKEALELYREQAFDVIIMDCQMPVMDGYTASVKIKEIGNPYIIAYTAGVTPEEKERCSEHKMDDFLPKPLELEQLRATLKRFLSKKMN